ncbi:DUF4188 domain-containing protein [Bacillus songklensis]|uniref:DUF4188 domain-containing protein n=1 Tax=Bacillus songklensis TaxID=1069116 RepID=A0ABV8B8N3_9BACI
MSTKIHNGAFTAETEDGFVVFIIGVRLNKIRALFKWLSAIKAMMPMLKELYQNPELGFLQEQTVIGWRTVTTIQYWRTYEQLETYSKGNIHSEALKNFYKKIGKSGSVGLYHETYKVEKDESLYINMPVYGLAKAFSHIRINNKLNTSKKRMERA